MAIQEPKNFFFNYETNYRDYHTEMNGDTFENWLENKLLPALDEPSIVLLDNASYHTRKDPATTAPTTASKLDEMRQWLRKKRLDFPEKGPGSHKKDLLKLSTVTSHPRNTLLTI